MKLFVNKCSCEDTAGLTGVSIVSNFSAHARHTTYEGRATLIVPVIMLRQTVVNGAFVSVDELIAESWNGVPVTVAHPDDNGEFLSANSPDVLAKFAVGRIFNARIEENKLRAEAWIDIERANKIKPGLIAALEAGEQMDVSTGYFAKQNTKGGTYDGKPYTITHHDIKPDHLALLPDESGACSWLDGCGVRANTEVDTMKVSELVTLITNTISGDESGKIINELIANDKAPFTQDDAETLRAMRKEVLIGLRNTYKDAKDMGTHKPVVLADLEKLGYDKVTAEKMVKAANEEVKEPEKKPDVKEPVKETALPTTVEAMNALIANGVAAALKTAMPAALAETRRPELLAKVIANTAHTKEAAEKMDTATLEIIVAGIKPQIRAIGSHDYSGRQAPVANASEVESKRAKGMVPLSLAEYSANAKKAAVAAGDK